MFAFQLHPQLKPFSLQSFIDSGNGLGSPCPRIKPKSTGKRLQWSVSQEDIVQVTLYFTPVSITKNIWLHLSSQTPEKSGISTRAAYHLQSKSQLMDLFFFFCRSGRGEYSSTKSFFRSIMDNSPIVRRREIEKTFFYCRSGWI